jgi:hypothetical protein
MPARSRTAAWLSFFLLVVMLLTTIPASAAPASPESPDVTGLSWLIDTVDGSESFDQMSSRSLRLDNNNNPVVVFGGRKLYHAKYSGGDWDISVVDDSYNVGSYASVAIDDNNRPHISYFDATNGKLKYATIIEGDWKPETVTAAGSGVVGQYTSIDVDTHNRPHIVYYDVTNQKLGYVYKNSSGNWVQETISNAYMGKYASLDMDGDKPHVSYYNQQDNALMYAVRENNVWTSQFVDRRDDIPAVLGGIGLYTSIIYARNKAQISYYNAYRGDLMYAVVTRNNDGDFNFSSDVVRHITGEKVGKFTSIDVDNNGNPYISYFNETNDDLLYAYTSDSGWKFSDVATDGRTGFFTSLAINRSNNRPYISYFDYTRGSMRLASLSSGKWNLQTIKTSGINGQYISMQLDSHDYPHLAYYDEGTPGLRYTYWNGSQWIYWILDTGSSNGLYATIALDSNNNPHIAYYNGATNDLRYRYWTGSAWSGITVVDETGDVGKYASIAIDSNNNPHISYYDSTNRRLLYAYKTASGWVKGIQVDNIGDVGKDTSLALDSNNAAHITYFDESNDRLKYAYYAPASGTWNHEIVDEGGSVGLYSSLKLDTFGIPHVSYYDFTPNYPSQLKYAVRTGMNQWAVTVVDGHAAGMRQPESDAAFAPDAPDVVAAAETVLPTGVGAYSSLALDSLNLPHISYYDATNEDLKYALGNGSGWELHTVYSSGNTGLYTQIGVNSSNLPAIGFQDVTSRAVKYAHAAYLNFEVFLPLNTR